MLAIMATFWELFFPWAVEEHEQRNLKVINNNNNGSLSEAAADLFFVFFLPF